MSNKKLHRPLILANGKPAGKGSITVIFSAIAENIFYTFDITSILFFFYTTCKNIEIYERNIYSLSPFFCVLVTFLLPVRVTPNPPTSCTSLRFCDSNANLFRFKKKKKIYYVAADQDDPAEVSFSNCSCCWFNVFEFELVALCRYFR